MPLFHSLKFWKMRSQGRTLGRKTGEGMTVHSSTGGRFSAIPGERYFTAGQGDKVLNMKIANGWRRIFRVPAALLGVSLAFSGAAVSFPAAAWAQLSDQDTTSTRGTQFIRQPIRKPPPPQEKPPEKKPDRPVSAAVVSPTPKTIPPPPKYPSVVFLLDISDSMLNRSEDRRSTRIKEAKDAMIRVLGDMQPETRVQLWTFSRKMKPVLVKGVPQGRFIPIGRRDYREQLIDRVRALRTSGGTNLFRSVIKALAFFDHPRDQALYRSGQRFPVLVVVSDGEDGGKTRETMRTVKKEKGKRPLVTINTIGFSISKKEGWFQELCLIATRPTGCATAGNRAELQNLLESFYHPPKRR